MTQPYAPPKEQEGDESLGSLIPKRRFWIRALWVSIAGVIVPPCFGLIGTVVGMVSAFGTLSESGQAEPEELAGDISIALLTTMWGLIVSAVFVVALVVSIIRLSRLNQKLNRTDPAWKEHG